MKITEQLTQNKYVAFIDVLGFKEMVKTKGDRLDIYFDTIKNALGDIERTKYGLDFQLVSDSTILACDLSRDALRLLLKAVQTIQSRCALENIWMRGAISIGDICFDQDLKIVVGNGLSDAYVLESQEKFPRVIIDPRILKNDFGTREVFIQEYNNTFVGPGGELRPIPLIHDLRGGPRFIENDAFFISFAERIVSNNPDDLQYVYGHIQSELYQGQKNYPKYFWLKNYFTEALRLWSTSEGSGTPTGNIRETALEYSYKFEYL